MIRQTPSPPTELRPYTAVHRLRWRIIKNIIYILHDDININIMDRPRGRDQLLTRGRRPPSNDATGVVHDQTTKIIIIIKRAPHIKRAHKHVAVAVGKPLRTGPRGTERARR